MKKTSFLLICMLLEGVCAVLPTDISRLITYDCLPDGIIHIHGVPKGYTVTSLNGASSCHVTQIDTHDYALGVHCTQRVYQNYPYYTYLYQADVQLSHASSQAVGGAGFSPFRLICDKVHSGGQTFTVESAVSVYDRSGYGSSVIPTLPYKRKSENNRRYTSPPQLTISRSQYSTQQINDNVYAGNLLYVHITSDNSHYSVRPENCTAKNDEMYYSFYDSRRASVELWDITQDRCVLEPYLMEKFNSMDTDQTNVAAPLYAFHLGGRINFGNTRNVHVECIVRVCSRRSFSCSLSVCDDVRREGRSAEEEEDDDCDRHEVSAKITISSSASAAVRDHMSIRKTLLGAFIVMLGLFK